MNYYEQHLDNLVRELNNMMIVSEVVNFYKSIHYGTNEKAKKMFACMSFLFDPKFDADEWVKKAIHTFDTDPFFAPFAGVSETEKVLYVKVYRKLIQKKRKAKLDPVVTADELSDELMKMLK
jgi:hypothetical protein